MFELTFMIETYFRYLTLLQNVCDECHKMVCVEYKMCNTIQYNTVQYSTVQYSTVQYNTIQYNTIQYNTIQYNTIQYSAVQCSAVQCSAVQCSAVQCSAVQCSTVQYSTVQYSTCGSRRLYKTSWAPVAKEKIVCWTLTDVSYLAVLASQLPKSAPKY